MKTNYSCGQYKKTSDNRLIFKIALRMTWQHMKSGIHQPDFKKVPDMLNSPG